MSIINDAMRMQTALKISEWNTSAISSMTQAKQHYTAIETQLEAMRENEDYSEGDIKEVESMLLTLNGLAVLMTNSSESDKEKLIIE